jgi:putative ABC transport system permease protein
MEKVVAIFLAITGVVSVISSIVGGLLIVNTMAMAVVERRREIAIRVAVGASALQVAGEFVVESALLSVAGTILGLGAGALAIAILDPVIVSRLDAGESLFRMSPRLIAIVAAYGVFLGVSAGLFPAFRAARADPARGLREL